MKTYTLKDHKVNKSSAVNYTVHATEYDSIVEFEKDLLAKEVSKLFNPNGTIEKKNLSSHSGGQAFTGSDSFDEALGLMRNGWDYGTKELVKKLKIKSNSSHTEMVRKTVYDIVGFQACVPRYLQGVPQNMVNKRLIPQKQKVITLVKDVCYPASISQEKILQDSVTFLNIVKAIEDQGIRVNIHVAFLSKVRRQWSWVRLKIKGSNERLNISKMAFAMAHPSFLRRMLFQYIETDNRLTEQNFTGGYGRPGEYNETTSLLKDNEYLVKQFNTLENVMDDLKTLKKY